jgi:hypothetical protein
VNPLATVELGFRNRKLETAALVLIGLLAAVCIAVPAYVFLGRIYSWHLKQPETVQGGIELIVVFVILALAAVLPGSRRICTIVFALVAALYLQLHSILLPAITAWLLLECLMHTGRAVQRVLRTGDWQDHQIRACLGRFVIGAASWMAGALIFSAFGLGSIPYLRFYTFALAMICGYAAPGTPLITILIRRFEQLHSKDKLLFAFLLVLILTQFGKANYGNDFYGLRPERILTGAHSLFDDLKLLHFVYYYPKQFEMLTLPLANLNHGTFIIPFNVVLLALGLLAIFQIARDLNLGRTGALLVTGLAGSIPALSNMGSTAKPDTLLSVYAFISVVYLWKWCKERSALDLAYGLAALFGMSVTKITAYAYAPLLAVGFLFVGWWLRHSDKRLAHASNRNIGRTASILVITIAALACAGLVLRTWILTGIPTMPAFGDQWQMLGLSPKYPWSVSGFVYGGVPIENVKEFLIYFCRLLFNPQGYPHYLMVWPGNAGFFASCAIAILAAIRALRGRRQAGFLLACMPILLGGIFMACVVRTPPQGVTDGNYYAVPVVLTILCAAGMVATTSGRTRALLTACTFGFILLQLPIMFVSHWSWHPGTQAFSLSLTKPLVDRKAESEARLKKAGAWEIEEYLRRNPRGLCVGFSNGEEDALHTLSCIHEDFEQSGGPYWPLFASKAAFRRYLDWAHPDLFIMPKNLSYRPCGPGTPIRLVFEELAQNKDAVRIESESFIALDLSGLRASIPGAESATQRLCRSFRAYLSPITIPRVPEPAKRALEPWVLLRRGLGAGFILTLA